MNVVEIIPLINEKNNNETDYLINCLVATIKPVDASIVLDKLSQNLSLHRYNLQHLKRIRKQEKLQVLLCPVVHSNDYNSMPSDDSLFTDIVNVLVPKYSPDNRQEFETWSKYWSINYRPNELERERSKGINNNELQFITNNVDLLLKENELLLQLYNKNSYGCLIVNSNNNKIAMTTTYALSHLIRKYGDVILDHPLYNPTLLTIEGIAAVVREDLQPINNDYSTFPEDHYLCTSLDIYLVDEPDMMASMALVHSRIRRIYFINDNINNGAVKSNYRLQELRSLNHKYRVFKIIS